MPEAFEQRKTPPERPSPWNLGGLTVRQLSLRVWHGINDDDVFGRAGQVAYGFLFAVFPLFMFLLSILGIVAGPHSAIQQNLVMELTDAMPPTAAQMVQHVIAETTRASGSGKLSFGLILTLIAATAAMTNVMDTLNSAYNVREGRSFLRFRAIAVWLTVAIGILMVLALTIVLYGNGIANSVGNLVNLGEVTTWIWKIAQWPVAVFFLLLCFALIYYFGPDVEFPVWHWISPGAVAGVFLWAVVSFGLRVYLHFFNSYTKTYGSLGAVMILLLWFYVTGIAILIGGEVNAEIENAAAKRGVPEAKEKGEKKPGTKPGHRAA
ncbi:MAG TPA: YihY/virulence factor BrkB family protein [Terriglobales bacterium]|nr:YihY/virulence factor BrkB family protein [Terriglobales bacterium]